MEILERIKRKRTPQSYAEQTHASPWRLIRFAHEKRMEVATDLVADGDPSVILDYGSGDGFLVEQVLDTIRPDLVVAYEPLAEMRDVISERLAGRAGATRIEVCGTLAEARAALGGAPIDALACLGVLEHLPLVSREEFYAFALEHVAPSGGVIVDIPIEIGPAVLVKEVARRALKGRPAEYRVGELLRRSVGVTRRDPARFDPEVEAEFITFHAGFDHRYVVEEIERHFEVTDRVTTPIAWAPTWLCNQELLFRAVPR